MDKAESKKCPKCGGELVPGNISHEVRILKEGDWVGDKVGAFYCSNCGFIELYKQRSGREPWRWPKKKETPPNKPQPEKQEEPQPETPRKRLIR